MILWRRFRSQWSLEWLIWETVRLEEKKRENAGVAVEGRRGGGIKDERHTRTNRYTQRLGLRLCSRTSRETGRESISLQLRTRSVEISLYLSHTHTHSQIQTPAGSSMKSVAELSPIAQALRSLSLSPLSLSVFTLQQIRNVNFG